MTVSNLVPDTKATILRGHYKGAVVTVVGPAEDATQSIVQLPNLSKQLVMNNHDLEELVEEPLPLTLHQEGQKLVDEAVEELMVRKEAALSSLTYLTGILDMATSRDDRLRGLCHEELFIIREFIEN